MHIRLALLLLMVVSTTGTLRAQNEPSSSIRRAAIMLRNGDIEASRHLLDSLMTVYPKAIRGWNLLATAQRADGDAQASLRSYLRALDLQPGLPLSMLNVGIGYALTGSLDSSFAWLGRARATGKVDMNSVMAGPAASVLKEDSRYPGLFPTANDYADPFVEETTIIHQWVGENARDQFSWVARNVGDIDGDGIDDLSTSAPTNSSGAARAGKIYAYSGRTGQILWSFEGTREGGQLGFSVESAGDVNGDGTQDIIAGAPFANTVLVLSGRDGRILLTLEGSDSTGGFGTSVRGIGDVNADGKSDLLIGEPFQIFGAPVNNGSTAHPGRAHVFSGADGSSLLELTEGKAGDGFGTAVAGRQVDGQLYFVVGAPNAGDRNGGLAYLYRKLSSGPTAALAPDSTSNSFGGMFISVVGDTNADGIQDIYVSDFSDGSKGPATGRIYVFSGTDGSRLSARTGDHSGDGFGIGVADAGDVDRDGHDDLIVGAWQYSSVAPSGGRIYILSGSDGSTMRTITGKIPGETLGFDATGMGDVDGDGVVDFLVTSTWSSINGFHSGRMFVLSGK